VREQSVVVTVFVGGDTADEFWRLRNVCAIVDAYSSDVAYADRYGLDRM